MKAFLFTCSVLIVGFFIFFGVFGNHISRDAQMKVWFSPLYGAFFGVSFLSLLFATPKNRSHWERVALWIIGLLFLVLQGGCWGAATAFGKATGGAVDDSQWHHIIAIAVSIFIFWSLAILCIALKK